MKNLLTLLVINISLLSSLTSFAATSILLAENEQIVFDAAGTGVATATVVNVGEHPLEFVFGPNNKVTLPPGKQMVRTGPKLGVQKAASKPSLRAVIVLETQ